MWGAHLPAAWPLPHLTGPFSGEPSPPARRRSSKTNYKTILRVNTINSSSPPDVASRQPSVLLPLEILLESADAAAELPLWAGGVGRGPVPCGAPGCGRGGFGGTEGLESGEPSAELGVGV